ncbi:hypothetical protein TNCV_2361451 [Trichonephila clavipes]|nr:hypothetical protein TNCV_2361451 [Trichonephila clavipes]
MVEQSIEFLAQHNETGQIFSYENRTSKENTKNLTINCGQSEYNSASDLTNLKGVVYHTSVKGIANSNPDDQRSDYNQTKNKSKAMGGPNLVTLPLVCATAPVYFLPYTTIAFLLYSKNNPGTENLQQKHYAQSNLVKSAICARYLGKGLRQKTLSSTAAVRPGPI